MRTLSVLSVLWIVFSIAPAWADGLVDSGEQHERDGRYASAIAMYLQAERELRVEADASSVQLRTIVKSRIQQLAPVLSSLKIIVPRDARGLEIVRDGRAIERDEWNRDMPIDGGTYRITVRARGRTAWSTTVQVRTTGDRHIVEIPHVVAGR